MKYYLGAAKLVVTGGQNVIFWKLAPLNHTIPLSNKLLFEFMQKLFLCSLVVGVTLSTSLPPRMTILVPSNSRLLTDLFMGCVGELTSLWLLRACLSLAAALRDSVGFILFLFLD